MASLTPSPGVSLEYQNALLDAQNTTHEYGIPIVVYLRGEAQVTRDSYGGIIARNIGSPIYLNADEVDYQPTERKMEKSGLREKCDVLIITAMKDWIDKGIGFDDIEIKRTTFSIPASPGEADGTLYDVKEKSRINRYGPGFLNISFGLSKR